VEVDVFDLELNRLGVIDQIDSFIWIRRYWGCGEFKLLVPFTERHAALLQKYRLVIKSRGDEAAQIRFVDMHKNPDGIDVIEVQGRMLPCWLDKRIVWDQIVARANTQNILYRLVRENVTAPRIPARQIPRVAIAESPDLGSGLIDYANEPFISCLLACESAAKAAKLGFKVITDVVAGRHDFTVYKGRELTADQNENPPCIFSQEFDNILEQQFTNSIENLKSFALVGGEEREDTPRKFAQVGTASGMDRDEIFVNATGLAQTYTENNVEITLPDATYLDMLIQYGASELEQYAETLNFASTINTTANLKYTDDFDLGDRVTCVNKRWGIQINVRITEIMETYQGRDTDIDITFGESIPTLIEQIRKLVK
jgi:hypothetical protein